MDTVPTKLLPRPGRRPALIVWATALLALALAQTGPAAGQATAPVGEPTAAPERAFTDTFDVDRCAWASTGGNPYFSLDPGRQSVLRGEEDGEAVELVITVLDQTETVGGVETRVVEARERADGDLTEVSRNYFAVCTPTSSVFYFGEAVDFYEGGQVVNHEGSWRADEGENRPALIMPAQPLLGARYHTELAPGVAMDRAEIVAYPVRAETPAGTFAGCFAQADTTPLEPGLREEKIYCPDVGLVRDVAVELVRMGPAEGIAPATISPAG